MVNLINACLRPFGWRISKIRRPQTFAWPDQIKKNTSEPQRKPKKEVEKEKESKRSMYARYAVAKYTKTVGDDDD